MSLGLTSLAQFVRNIGSRAGAAVGRMASSFAMAPAREPSGGRYAIPIPHERTFVSLANTVSQTYRHTYDEALRHSKTNALAMRRDAFILGVLRERQLSVAQLPWHIECEDARDPAQKAGSKRLTDIIRRTPRLTGLFMSLTEAVWYGRYAAQLAFGPAVIAGRPATVTSAWSPVNGDKIQYAWNGTPMVMVSPTVKDEIEDCPELVGHDRSLLLPLQRSDLRDRFVIHKHECEDADFFEAELSGGVHGVGLRSRIYWMWWMRDEMLTWAVDYMQKVGTMGLMLFYYEEGNPESLAAAEQSAREVSHRAALAVPLPKGSDKTQAGVDILPASTGGVSALTDIISNYFERHIERLVIGQSLSSKAEATGLGSSVADQHADTKYRIIKYDAEMLADTLTNEFVRVLQRHNLPGDESFYRFVFDVPRPEAKDQMAAAEKLVSIGVRLKADEVRALAGLSKPEDGDETIGNPPVDSPRAKSEPPAIGLANPARAREPDVPVTFDGDEWPVEYGKELVSDGHGGEKTINRNEKDGRFGPSNRVDMPNTLTESGHQKKELSVKLFAETRRRIEYIGKLMNASDDDIQSLTELLDRISINPTPGRSPFNPLTRLADWARGNASRERLAAAVFAEHMYYNIGKSKAVSPNRSIPTESQDNRHQKAAETLVKLQGKGIGAVAERYFADLAGWNYVGDGAGLGKTGIAKAFDMVTGQKIKHQSGQEIIPLVDLKMTANGYVPAENISGENKNNYWAMCKQLGVSAVPILAVGQYAGSRGGPGFYFKINGKDWEKQSINTNEAVDWKPGDPVQAGVVYRMKGSKLSEADFKPGAGDEIMKKHEKILRALAVAAAAVDMETLHTPDGQSAADNIVENSPKYQKARAEAEAAKARAEAAEARAEKLSEILRSLGRDPDKL